MNEWQCTIDGFDLVRVVVVYGFIKIHGVVGGGGGGDGREWRRKGVEWSFHLCSFIKGKMVILDGICWVIHVLS